jgi:hypothetical protein
MKKSLAKISAAVVIVVCGGALWLPLTAQETTEPADEPIIGAGENAAASDGQTDENPYLTIVRRNAFGLKEKPTPPPKEEKKEETIEADELDLIISGFGARGDKRFVYFKVPDEDNKGKYQYYTVDVDDTGANPIDVLEIGEKTVDIRYKGGKYTLELASVQNKLTRTASNNRTSNPGNRNVQPRTGGNNSGNTTASSSTASTTPAQNYASNRNVSRAGNTAGRTSLRGGQLVNGNQVLPRRNVRVGGDGGDGQRTPDEQIIIMEANKQYNESQGIPMPPTPGLPTTTAPAGGF